jgi:uncharacterized protein (DUF488 family)
MCALHGLSAVRLAKALSVIVSVGHSTLSQDSFLDLLGRAGVPLVWDVRSYPTSRWEWFKRGRLEEWLPAAGVQYVWAPALGGRRPMPGPGDPLHAAATTEAQGWQEQGFASYQWHMATPAFFEAADQLVQLGRQGTVAIMCSEGVWWRCHRSMIADYLVTAGADVVHLQPRRLDHATVVAERLPRYAPSVLSAWRRRLGRPLPDVAP